MTNFNRSTLPDTVRSNGATPNPWWANAVVYQIYPRSFQDTNGVGKDGTIEISHFDEAPLLKGNG